MNKHYVVLVEVLAFPLLKSASLVTFLYGGVTFEAKYLFGKSLYSYVSIWIC